MRRKIPGTPGMSSTVDIAVHTTRKWSVVHEGSTILTCTYMYMYMYIALLIHLSKLQVSCLT